ncbi:NAD(P)-dependent alcohol dehydrogenase [Actinoalloteichus sp. AHMU CJ021]|uniref:alcohol dehydrogenase n=1 Tax=Actinoalloteichus caeruleus DSM 43889 TaxID=1120930 RepID=A0ABT1JGI1_ACTCY|nr:NAD(P)-dependent alcohol dehydrogenase [Actinoalloteichus caeruleus]AUS81461.1 NAD(P)-dependent alcohol dehydrogenase [Actinoalloteichus sp. AHMU CJ021]MCP2331614.1 alcohol dehydrogenase, propanol-preferring [Actinoalloteichus caeruleus DSM 43889]
MRAVQYTEIGAPPVVVDVPTPEPGPGEVLLRVTAAGVCHSDITVMDWSASEYPYPLPLTLGHEGAGVVAAVGPGVEWVTEGESCVVYGPWGCGTCRKCTVGKENYCLRADRLGIRPPGLGAPGALAEYLLVDDPRHLVPIGDLDPVRAVPLTDAGLTPYHAIARSASKLVPGSTAVVIGAGGLGHLGIQILRATTSARVVALDVSEEKMALAREVGAHVVFPSDQRAPEAVRELTGGGADVVLDFVGLPATAAIAAACAGVESDVVLVGVEGGSVEVGFGTLPFETTVTAPYWGSRGELLEVLDLARSGQVEAEVERYGLEEAPAVYERLRARRIRGRGVIVPGG